MDKATKGGGMSWTIKKEILDLLMSGENVIVTDPKNECISTKTIFVNISH